LADTDASMQADGELHSFVKLAIAYLGIMAGLAVLGVVFFTISSQGEAQGSVRPSAEAYNYTMGLYALMIGLSLGGLAALANHLRLGAYLAFLALVVWFMPYATESVEALAAASWMVIPNGVVGILLLRALKTLR
jgi:hypothetical protein